MLRAGIVAALAASAAFAGESDAERENARLREELAHLRASDPDAATRRAVEQYLDETRAAPPAPVASVYDGGFSWRSADGLHSLRANVFARFGWFNTRDTSRTNGITQYGFELEALRLRLAGHAYTERLTYLVELEFAPRAGRYEDDADTVSEAYLTYQRRPWRFLRFRGGRFRVPFAASEIPGDDALEFADRSLLNEYFTIGRSDALGVILEGLRGRTERFEFTMSNGSERFHPGAPFRFDDTRIGFTGRLSRTLVGEGDPAAALAFEGDPEDSGGSTIVAGLAAHYESAKIRGAPQANYWQFTADATWRRRGTWLAAAVFYRRNLASGTTGLAADEDEWGAHAALARFLVPRRVELALRGAWISYASHADPGGDLLEVTFGFNFYWLDESGTPPGQRLRVTLDFGYAENVAVTTGTADWAQGHVHGILFRSQLTIVF